MKADRLQKTILVIRRALFSGIQTIASGKPRISAFSWPSRRTLVAAGLLLLVFALIAPGIPMTVYRRYPTISGFFSPPVDPVYLERGCIVHVVNQIMEGDYYLECPSTEHPLFYWNPIIALPGILTFSLGSRRFHIDPWTRRLSVLLEALVGFEGIVIAFGTLLGPWIFEAIPGLLGYPIGFFAVLHSMRRAGAGALAQISVASLILLVSGIVFFLMLIASIGMSEY